MIYNIVIMVKKYNSFEMYDCNVMIIICSSIVEFMSDPCGRWPSYWSDPIVLKYNCTCINVLLGIFKD